MKEVYSDTMSAVCYAAFLEYLGTIRAMSFNEMRVMKAAFSAGYRAKEAQGEKEAQTETLLRLLDQVM